MTQNTMTKFIEYVKELIADLAIVKNEHGKKRLMHDPSEVDLLENFNNYELMHLDKYVMVSKIEMEFSQLDIPEDMIQAITTGQDIIDAVADQLAEETEEGTTTTEDTQDDHPCAADESGPESEEDVPETEEASQPEDTQEPDPQPEEPVKEKSEKPIEEEKPKEKPKAKKATAKKTTTKKTTAKKTTKKKEDE